MGSRPQDAVRAVRLQAAGSVYQLPDAVMLLTVRLWMR